MSRPSLQKLLFTSVPFRFGMVFAIIGPAQLLYFLITGAVIFEPSKVLEGRLYTEGRDMSLILGGMFFVIGGMTALFSFLKARNLDSRGMIVTGRVQSVSGFQYRGMKNISYTYNVDRNYYESRTSVAATKAENYVHSPSIQLLVDAKNPTSHVILE